ncbi:MAG: glycosyltransferase [Candidatus Sumerlaeaceae bacterium]
MRIGIDVQTLETFEAKRGIGRLCRSTIEALLRHAPEHKLVLFGRSPEPAPDVVPCLARGAEYVPIEFDGTAEQYLDHGAVAHFLWRTKAAHSLDVFHVTSPLMPDIVIPHTAPCPIVATLLDAIPALMNERRQPMFDEQAWERYCQRVRVLRSWQAFAAISNTTADDCVRLFDLDEEDVFVTYVPVEQRPLAGWTTERIGAVLADYNLWPGYVLSITGYHPRKNFQALFGAYGRLAARLRARAPLVIVCSLSPAEKEQLYALAQKHHCSDHVRLLGFVPDEHFPAILASAGVLFFPSRLEGFGLPVAEAMAAGVPVVTSNRSSLPEVVGDGGLMCDPDDHRGFAAALQEVLENPDRRIELQARGFVQVSKFSPQHFAKRLVECYHDAARRIERQLPTSSVSSVSAEGGLRVAVFTPLSPKMSGIADFAEQLLLNFSQTVHPECYTEDYVPAHPLIRERIPVRPHWEFEREHERRPYDLILYELGNNVLHAYMLPYVELYPGIIDLHDFSILGLFQHLEREYGWAGEAHRWLEREQKAAGERHGKVVDLAHLDPLKVPMTRWLLRHHRAFVVHSQWLKDHLHSLAPQHACIEHIPLGVDLGMVRLGRPPREELRRKYHLSRNAFVIACVGVANRLKRLPQVFAAFREFNFAFPESYLVFVGPADRIVLRELTQMAARYRLKNRIRVLGHRPLPEFYEILELADICVNLRYPTMGESSATLVAALAMGKPTLVTPLGQYAEFPDDVCPKVPIGAREKRVLIENFCRFCEDPQWKETIGQNARRYMEHWAYHQIAARYELLFLEILGRKTST